MDKMFEIYLNEDDFISTNKDTDSAVLNYEKSIIDESNNYDIDKSSISLQYFQNTM